MARRPSKRVPRYREIAQTLRLELAGEVYSLRGLFPKELDLCERFSVSRFTIGDRGGYRRFARGSAIFGDRRSRARSFRQ